MSKLSLLFLLILFSCTSPEPSPEPSRAHSDCIRHIDSLEAEMTVREAEIDELRQKCDRLEQQPIETSQPKTPILRKVEKKGSKSVQKTHRRRSPKDERA